MQTRWPDLEEWLFGSTLGPGCHRDSGLDPAVADPAACAGEGQLSIPPVAAEASLIEALAENLAGLAERWDRVGADGGRVNTTCSTNFRAQPPWVLKAKWLWLEAGGPRRADQMSSLMGE
jgi:hypothetical protein